MKQEFLHETKTHGMLTFPYTAYNGNLPEYLPSVPLHWHDEMEFIYVTGGGGVVTISSVAYNVKPGDILVVLPQMVHSIERYPDQQLEYFNILFRFSLLNASENVLNHSITTQNLFPFILNPGQLSTGRYVPTFPI